MEINSNLLNKLKNNIPCHIDDFGLLYPDHQNGYIRFDYNKLHSIYLENIIDKYNNNIILKFDNRYQFQAIYVCADKCNEYRYNRDLELDAVYLKDISILPNLHKNKKLHILKVLIEWQKLSKILGKHEYISTYQIEKNEKDIMHPYVISNKPIQLENKCLNVLDSLVDNFDKSKVKWGYKWDKHSKEINVVYLIIDKLNTNHDG